MSLPHIILSLLVSEKQTGYNIYCQLAGDRDAIANKFWTSSHQQIYRELGAMEKKLLVTCVEIPQEGNPNRKLYTITKSGKAHYLAWLEKAPSLGIIRDAMVARVYNAKPSEYPVVLTSLGNYQILVEEKLHDLGISLSHAEGMAVGRQKALDELVILNAISHFTNLLNFAVDSQAMIKARMVE